MDKQKLDTIVRSANRSEIHRATGISLSGVSRILSGRRRAKADNLSLIADQLGVTMDDLYTHLRELRNKVLGKRNRSAAA